MDKERKFEEKILASFERGEWQPSSKSKNEIARFSAMARRLWQKTRGPIFPGNQHGPAQKRKGS